MAFPTIVYQSRLIVPLNQQLNCQFERFSFEQNRGKVERLSAIVKNMGLF